MSSVEGWWPVGECPHGGLWTHGVSSMDRGRPDVFHLPVSRSGSFQQIRCVELSSSRKHAGRMCFNDFNFIFVFVFHDSVHTGPRKKSQRAPAETVCWVLLKKFTHIQEWIQVSVPCKMKISCWKLTLVKRKPWTVFNSDLIYRVKHHPTHLDALKDLKVCMEYQWSECLIHIWRANSHRTAVTI